MSLEGHVDGVAFLFTLDGYFKVEAMVFSAAAAVGRRDTTGFVTDDFQKGFM